MFFFHQIKCITIPEAKLLNCDFNTKSTWRSIRSVSFLAHYLSASIRQANLEPLFRKSANLLTNYSISAFQFISITIIQYIFMSFRLSNNLELLQKAITCPCSSRMNCPCFCNLRVSSFRHPMISKWNTKPHTCSSSFVCFFVCYLLCP